MRRAPLVALAFAAVLARLPVAVAQEPPVALSLPPASSALVVGEPFVVVVEVRGAAPRFEPVPAQWRPLVVEGVQVEPAAAGHTRFLVTVRGYRAGESDIGPVQVGFADGRTASSGPLRLDLRSALPEPPGELEWPGDVRELPGARWPWWCTALAVVALGFALQKLRRQQPVPVVVVPEPIPPALGISARLAALALPQQQEDWEPFCMAVKALLRTHLAAAHALRAEVATSEELLRALGAPRPLARCLATCDLVLFGALRPALASSSAVRDAALEFVRGPLAVPGGTS
ncbi:MAG: hypothetical protein JNL12_12205 [Planctomycetes bacterium]|nr:hypothetical protein [Planctomycetota bacterium]